MKKLKVYFFLSIIFLVYACSEESEEGNLSGVASFSISELREVEGASIALNINIGIDNFNHGGGVLTISVEGGQYGTDFETSAGSATFDIEVEPGSLIESFAISPIDDELIEANKQLTITISNATGSLEIGEGNSIVLTIIDDDDPTISMISFASESQQIAENSIDPFNIVIAFDKPSTNGGAITIEAEGAAEYGVDYTVEGAGSSTFTIDVPGGGSEASFAVFPIDNDEFAEDKSIIFTLAEVSGGLEIISPNSTELILVNEDEPPSPTINFATDNPTTIGEEEEALMLNFVLSSALNGDATFTLEVDASSTATLGEDYDIDGLTNSPFTFSIIGGSTTASVLVNILDDDLLEEEDENVTLTISEVEGKLLVGVENPALTFQIIDDEEPDLPLNYLETFESYDGSDTFLTDILKWQQVIIEQTIPDQVITLIQNSGSFSAVDDPSGTSDHGLNIFYNTRNDPSANGELDNAVITPLLEGTGVMMFTVDVSYAFKNQNSGTARFYWSQTYNGDGMWNEADWNLIDAETVPDMDGEGFGNNSYKREMYEINPTEHFYIAMRVTQTVDDANYRLRWRFDNINVVAK